MKIYCFSGLGADQRVFQFLNLEPFEIVHVSWLNPLPDESLVSYAHRMGENIDENEPFILMGLSFGGMLVQEIAKIKKAHRVIVLSSIATTEEMPLRMRMMRFFKVYDFIPGKYFTQPSKIAFQMFGVTGGIEKTMLTEILKEGDAEYTRWAIKAIGNWKNKERVSAYRIHGDSDKLFPLKYVQANYIVKNGGHFMVVSQSQEIQKVILKALNA